MENIKFITSFTERKYHQTYTWSLFNELQSIPYK